MKLTAILCNYNGETYLRESIESVINQDRSVDEFIIVDDGSTDRSLKILEDYKCHSNIEIVVHGENLGQAAGFNSAIARATGDLICFIDSDDIWFSDKVRRMLEVAEADSNAAIIQHNLVILRNDQKTNELFRCCLSSGDMWKEWNQHIYFPYFTPTAGLAIRTEVAKKILPVPIHLKHSADSYLTRAAILHGNVFTIPSALGAYRKHTENAVHGNAGHNSWKFFLNEVAPYLHRYYLAQGVKSPIRKLKIWTLLSLRDKILDFSLRHVVDLVFKDRDRKAK